MPGKRSTTPLFDLLQRGRAQSSEPRPAAPEGDPSPARPASQMAPEQSAATTPRFSEGPIRIVGGIVHMPIAYAAVALAVALAGLLASWTLGYRSGEANAREDQALLKSVMESSARVVEPDAERTDGGAAPAQPQNAGDRAGPKPAAAGPPQFVVDGQPTSQDPRAKGNSYLQLQSFMRLSDVQSAHATLQGRGISSIAVMDPKTLRRREGPLYVLFAGLGFPGAETSGTAAKQYEQQVRAAGVAWKKAGGINNFDDAFWKPYNP